MRYTNHLSSLVRENGVPELNKKQFDKLMNVVHLEGKLLGLKRAVETTNNTEDRHKFDMKIFETGKQLTLMTENISPELFFEKLLQS